MNTKHSFEVSSLDGRVWVRPYDGNVEYNGETYATLAEALADIPQLAADLGWTDYNITIDN